MVNAERFAIIKADRPAKARHDSLAHRTHEATCKGKKDMDLLSSVSKLLWSIKLMLKLKMSKTKDQFCLETCPELYSLVTNR